MKRMIALLCGVIMLLSVLVGCNKTNVPDGSDTTDGVGSQDVTDTSGTQSDDKRPIEYDDKGYVKDYIPEDIDFNEKEIKIVGWNGDKGETDFITDYSDGGDVGIAKATYERNAAVEKRLNVKLDIDYSIMGNNASREKYYSTVTQNMMVERYDLIACYSQLAANFATDGYTVDLMEYDHILNFDRPWWSETLAEESGINNKLYFASGSISTTNILQTMCIAINIDLMDGLGRDDPREMVKEGVWTMENFHILCKDTYLNKNEENPNKDSGDQFGFISPNKIYLDGFFTSNGLRYYDVDAEGRLKISSDLDGIKTENLITTLRTDFNTNDYLLESGFSTFFGGNALMSSTGLEVLMTNRSKINFNYGYVPFPSAEEGEVGYTVTGFPFTMWCMTTCPEGKDAEAAAYTMECLASEGYRKVQPEVYELIKYKNNDDPLNIEMFETLLKTKIYDLGRLFINVSDWDDCAVGLFRNAVADTLTGGWASIVESKRVPMQSAIDKINQSFGF